MMNVSGKRDMSSENKIYSFRNRSNFQGWETKRGFHGLVMESE